MQPSEAPLWPPPKAPLSTQRLAGIANALGIPIPTVRTPFPRSPSEPPLRTSVPSYSKYLLHVIPPQCLNHGISPSTNGYHPQFRRGVLVPVCANFQTQLALIAKEYALPSTTGMLLYLVTSDTAAATRNRTGPLLSEEIWKHLWTRVIRAEQMEDNIPLHSRRLYRLGSLSGDESIFSSQFDGKSSLSAGTSRSRSVASPSSSTSSTSDLRLNSKSLFMASPSDPGTPDTSQSSIDEATIKANRLTLPGLSSPSLVPVLAKVEFDIDHQKAGWLEPWLRSRRINHANRFKAKHDGSHESPLAFVTGTNYTPVSDDFDSEIESEAENATARVSLCTAAHGPLEDVFGMDTVEMHGRKSDGNEGGEKQLKMLHSHQAVISSSQEPSKHLSHETRVRSPEESEKVITIFDDLDFSLDPSVDFGDHVPYDKRRSQFLMMAKLDEIEKAMLQCSPRALKTSSEADTAITRQSPSKSTVSPSRNGGARREQLQYNNDLEIETSAWLLVPQSSLREPIPIKSDDSVAPTMIVETGVTIVKDGSIPLLPGSSERYPSTVVEGTSPPAEHSSIASRAHPPTATIVSSRFSLDSTDEVVSESSNRATLISVKSIKKLWRRSDKSNQSSNQLPPVPSSGRSSSNQLPSRIERHSKPDLPDATSLVIVDQSATASRSPSPNFTGPLHLEGLYLDQESPYPAPVPPLHFPRPTSPPLPLPPEPQKSTRKSILKWTTKPRNESVSQDATAGLEQLRLPSKSGIVEGLHARQSNTAGLVFNKHFPTDIPPNSSVPEQFIVNSRQVTPSPAAMPIEPQSQPTLDMNLSCSSTDSHASSEDQLDFPSRSSIASSRDSLYTRPSFDTSQFEIVSPKAAA